MKTIKNKLKLALATFGLLAVGTVSAQITSPTSTVLDKDADPTKTVRLIDNKGTIKYIQSKNGITQVTSTNAGNTTTTTWQLGGVLEENTYIAASTGKEFALDGLELVTSSAAASTDAVDRQNHGGAGTGFTVLLRDEASGAIQKIKLSDLLHVQEDHDEVTVSAANSADLIDNTPTALTGIEIDIEAQRTNIQVFRNGVKLRALSDYNIKTVDDSGTDRYFVYLIPNATVPHDWSLIDDDIIEVHAIR